MRANDKQGGTRIRGLIEGGGGRCNCLVRGPETVGGVNIRRGNIQKIEDRTENEEVRRDEVEGKKKKKKD